MQLGNATTALLIPVWKYGISDGVSMLLRSSSTTKLVWGPTEEKELTQMGIKVDGLLDIQQLSSAMGYGKKLDSVGKLVLVDELVKYRKKYLNHARFRSWETDNLPIAASNYAAHDVFSAYHIFQSLTIKRQPTHDRINSNEQDNDFVIALLKRKAFNCSGLSLYNQLLHTINSPNEISKMIYFIRVI